MRKGILVLVLALSIIAHLYLVCQIPALYPGDRQEELQYTLHDLKEQNAELSSQIQEYNASLETSDSRLRYYLQRIVELESQLNGSHAGLSGSSTLQAPVILERITPIGESPFVRQQVTEEGSMVNVTVEVLPGRGRVLVQTTPLMGIGFQEAGNTAVRVAENRSKTNLSASDVIFSIEAPDEIDSVDGPSAGALMATLVVSAVEGWHPNGSVTLSGTIDGDGRIGEVSGVVEKAEAARRQGKALLLLPEENAELVRRTELERDLRWFSVAEQRSITVDAKQHIEETVGIQVEYVGTIDDVLEYMR